MEPKVVRGTLSQELRVRLFLGKTVKKSTEAISLAVAEEFAIFGKASLAVWDWLFLSFIFLDSSASYLA